MSSGANFFLKKTLGEDFFESLEKFELWKPGTRTTIDHEEIKTALMIVPRTIMSLLINQLTPMEIGDTKEIWLGVGSDSSQDGRLRVTKHERDVYSGEIEQNNKRIVDFKYRSIPGVGLVIMSAFELYDTEKLAEPKQEHSQDVLDKVQKLIDERLALHDLVGKVVDKKVAERDAVQHMILVRLTEELKHEKEEAEKARVQLAAAGVAALGYVKEGEINPGDYGHSASLDDVMRLRKENEVLRKKGSPLKDFLQNRKEKIKKSEYTVVLAKGESVSCPDCDNKIFDGKVFSGCICFGDDMDKKLYISKSEEGVKVRFGKGWDPENIEMLLEVLRRKRG